MVNKTQEATSSKNETQVKEDAGRKSEKKAVDKQAPAPPPAAVPEPAPAASLAESAATPPAAGGTTLQDKIREIRERTAALRAKTQK